MLLGDYWEEARAADGCRCSECCIVLRHAEGEFLEGGRGGAVLGRPWNASPKVTHARCLRSKAAFVLLLVEERADGAEGRGSM
jgi:hypothetical protein